MCYILECHLYNAGASVDNVHKSECVCCLEIDMVINTLHESEQEHTCITQLEGFQPVCLNVWVLQAAYFTY